MSNLNVLISGGGIAGSVAAYWLGKAGANVTVIERAPALRQSGQGIDVRGTGLDIIEKMGVLEKIKKHTTHETGMMFVDDDNKRLLNLEVQGSQAFTAEVEIIRSDLANILYDAAISLDNVKHEFDLAITGLTQEPSKISVDLSNGQTRTYDVVIAADGFSSRTRRLALGPEKSQKATNSLHGYCTYFTLPREPQDTDYARWYMTTNKRSSMIRPKASGVCSAYMTIFTHSQSVREAQSSGSIDDQKAVIAEQFSDVKWEIPRLLKHMASVGPEDFYFQEIGQIKLSPSDWHVGRCALVGDAAYCPSPLTGMGTTLAIIGAYVLAGEIAAQPTNPEAAFRAYENRLGAYVTDVQKLPLGGRVVDWVNPATWWGLWILRTILWAVDRSGVLSLGKFFGTVKAEGVKLPTYEF